MLGKKYKIVKFKIESTKNTKNNQYLINAMKLKEQIKEHKRKEKKSETN